jgi:NAD(P)-dependent dehydrogenase (short-subunit alcohol dehydrogenase family)
MDYRNAFDMTGSVAVITGGARGIGFESAVALGSCGAKVVLASRDRSAWTRASSAWPRVELTPRASLSTWPRDDRTLF